MFNYDDNDNFTNNETPTENVNIPNEENKPFTVPDFKSHEENAASTVNENPTSAAEPTPTNYSEPPQADTTYHYGPSMQNNDNNATRYPYGQSSSQQSSAYNRQSGQYGGAPQYQQPDRGPQYPYNQQPYNGNRNPYSNYGNQPPVPPKNDNEPFYAKKTANNNGNKGGKLVFGIMAAVICVLLVAVIVILSGGDEVEPSTTLPANETIAATEEKTTSNSSVIAETQTTPGNGSPASLDSDALTPAEIYANVHESSVGLLVYDSSTTSLTGEGSGVAYGYDESGEYTYFVTCAHVISDAGANIVVQTSDDMKYDAEIVGFDTRTDIGVIRVKSTDFKLATYGDSSALTVGSAVYAIGNPGGTEFAGSFTDGIVSAIDRPVKSNTGYDIDCIQHTAAINPGNSGGALVNAFGQVIGINSMKIVDDEYEGMGFAVPVSAVIPVVKDLITYGYVANRPKLGVSFYEAASYNYFYYYFVMSNNFGEGSIIVAEISEDGALYNTNVQVGDVITEVNGTKLDSSDYLADLVAASSVGDKITLTIVRPTDQRNINQYDTFEVTVTLVEDTGTNTAEQQEEETTVFDPFSYYWNYGN